MPIPEGFPVDPYQVIAPELRWYPGEDDLNATDAAKLIPPLVARIREGVDEWRRAGYPGISDTSRILLEYWFVEKHFLSSADGTQQEFRYYFAQREAVETAVWLYENQQATDVYSLLRYDGHGGLSQQMFDENWTRYVFKLATGAGKTKVLSLLIAWSYFHKKYEPNSQLSTNFLLIAPNIIVLDRLRDDFDGLKIFAQDPIVPPNGWQGKDWGSDFHLNLHIQDQIGNVPEEGNLFLTNIHRVYEDAPAPSSDDEDLTSYFLGNTPVAKTTQGTISVGDVVRSVENLVVLNDEAHHIHDRDLAWFQSIESIDAGLRQRTGHGISAQFDVTATPKHTDGGIFVQTVCSYPLVEAIRQKVVKTPVVPDEPSRKKLVERASDNIYEQYEDHIRLGYTEWAKRREDLEKMGKKPILFIMTQTTQEADEIAEYLERTYSDLTGKVLVIHTNKKGEITEKQNDKELEALRLASSTIDDPSNPYLAVVSVLMLREGWDVQNVISMVGLRPYTATSQVLPEQTLGRGLRRMFRGNPDYDEYVSIVGTEAFLDFVLSVKSEGVEIAGVPMGGTEGPGPQDPLLIEVDRLNAEKDIDALDFDLPKLSERITRNYKKLEEIIVADLPDGGVELVQYSKEQQREIVFRDVDTDKTAWTTDLGERISPTPQAVVSFLAMDLMRRIRLASGQAVLFEKLYEYIPEKLFTTTVSLEDTNVLRNLSEYDARTALYTTFSKAINEISVSDAGSAQVVDRIKLSKTRPTIVNNQPFVVSKKSLFTKTVGDSALELRFANFLDQATDVKAFAKNGRNTHFFVEYVNSHGELSRYYPDFLVRSSTGEVTIVETKGLEDLDVKPKWDRLVLWCKDATDLEEGSQIYRPLFVSQTELDEFSEVGKTFAQLWQSFSSHGPIGAGS